MPQPRATEHYTCLLCADAKEGFGRGERGEVNVNCSHGCQCHVRVYTKSLMMEELQRTRVHGDDDGVVVPGLCTVPRQGAGMLSCRVLRH